MAAINGIGWCYIPGQYREQIMTPLKDIENELFNLEFPNMGTQEALNAIANAIYENPTLVSTKPCVVRISERASHILTVTTHVALGKLCLEYCVPVFTNHQFAIANGKNEWTFHAYESGHIVEAIMKALQELYPAHKYRHVKSYQVSTHERTVEERASFQRDVQFLGNNTQEVNSGYLADSYDFILQKAVNPPTDRDPRIIVLDKVTSNGMSMVLLHPDFHQWGFCFRDPKQAIWHNLDPEKIGDPLTALKETFEQLGGGNIKGLIIKGPTLGASSGSPHQYQSLGASTAQKSSEYECFSTSQPVTSDASAMSSSLESSGYTILAPQTDSSRSRSENFSSVSDSYINF